MNIITRSVASRIVNPSADRLTQPDSEVSCSAKSVKSSGGMRLQPSLSSLETWGFGVSGLLLWLGPAPAMHAALGPQAIVVWLPGVIVGMLLNWQVKRLGMSWLRVAGGTPNYTTRLLDRYPRLAAYSAVGYFVGWAAVPMVNAIILTDLLKANLAVLGWSCPDPLLKIGFTLLAFTVAFSGIRALGILHLFFIIPALGLLATFCVQGMGWLTFSAHSPGFFPTDWPPFSFIEWAKWFYITVYAVYACETASAFVADSRRPTATLRCLSVTAWLIPVIYLGGSWVLMRLSTASETGTNAFLNLLSAATPFWGQYASALVTFLTVSACLLGCATGFSNSPRVLYQLSLDGYLAPVLSATSRRGVLGPALIFTLLISLTCIVWGDVSHVVMVTGTGFFFSIMATHLGLWLGQDRTEVRWAGWSLGFFLMEGVVLVVGGLAWSWHDLLVGLLLPVAVLLIDAVVRRIPGSLFQPQWWIQRYRSQPHRPVQDLVASQVAVLLFLICGVSILTWSLRSTLEGIPQSISTNLFIVVLLSIAFVGIAIACWTSLPQVAAIAEAKERAEHLFAVASNAIVVLDETGAIQQTNPAAQRLFQLSANRLLGYPLNELLFELSDFPQTWASQSEQSLRLPNQALCIVEVSVSSATNPDSTVEYMVILQDITARKQTETALQQSEMQLRDKAQQLELALKELSQSQAQVIQSEKMSSLGQLVAGVAHEINNPVSFIHGNIAYVGEYAEGLLDLLQLYEAEYPQAAAVIQNKAEDIDLAYLRSDFPKLLTSMKVGTDRICGIVQSLRNFSRLDEAEVKPVDLHEGIDSTLMILQNRLKACGDRSAIQVIKDYGNLPLVECYAGQLNQVFMNILTNAIDALDEHQQQALATGQAGRSGLISIRTSLLGSDQVTIQLTDNGPGMTEDVQRRLLDPFFTTKPVGKGTGLGMAISHQIVTERHGGAFKWLSAPGQGTVFMITIPLYQKIT